MRTSAHTYRTIQVILAVSTVYSSLPSPQGAATPLCCAPWKLFFMVKSDKQVLCASYKAILLLVTECFAHQDSFKGEKPDLPTSQIPVATGKNTPTWKICQGRLDSAHIPLCPLHEYPYFCDSIKMCGWILLIKKHYLALCNVVLCTFQLIRDQEDAGWCCTHLSSVSECLSLDSESHKRLSRSLPCSGLTHCSQAWTLTHHVLGFSATAGQK